MNTPRLLFLAALAVLTALLWASAPTAYSTGYARGFASGKAAPVALELVPPEMHYILQDKPPFLGVVRNGLFITCSGKVMGPAADLGMSRTVATCGDLG